MNIDFSRVLLGRFNRVDSAGTFDKITGEWSGRAAWLIRHLAYNRSAVYLDLVW